ncbi:MAG TPA: AI-2E family transporter [Chloroflexia bacterium]|nr:AI-2E family transporter [Chloroflexia bacterium]
MAAIHFTARTKTILIWAGVLLTLAFLFVVRTIVVPFIWALVTVYILNAAVNFLTRRLGGPRVLWVVVIYFGLVAAIIWAIAGIGPALALQVRQLSRELPGYLDQAESFIGEIHIGDVRITPEQVTESVRQGLTAYLGTLSERAPELVRDAFESLLRGILYLLATFFFLLQTDRMVANVRSLFSRPVLDELDPWIRRINATLTSYLRGQVLLVIIITVATFIGLQVLGVRFPLALALMSGLVETIPYLGPYTAGAITVLVAMTQQEPNNFGWPPLMLGLAVAALYTAIRQTEDYLVVPLVIGRTVELHPLTVLFVVLAGASLAGIMGLLLAVPAAAVIKIIAEFLWLKIREPDAVEPVSVVGPVVVTEVEAPAPAPEPGPPTSPAGKVLA